MSFILPTPRRFIGRANDSSLVEPAASRHCPLRHRHHRRHSDLLAAEEGVWGLVYYLEVVDGVWGLAYLEVEDEVWDLAW